MLKFHMNQKNCTLRPMMVLLLASFLMGGCTKREFNLTEDTTLTGTLDPVFAVPLVHGTWSFGEVMDAIEIPATLEKIGRASCRERVC